MAPLSPITLLRIASDMIVLPDEYSTILVDASTLPSSFAFWSIFNAKKLQILIVVDQTVYTHSPGSDFTLAAGRKVNILA